MGLVGLLACQPASDSSPALPITATRVQFRTPFADSLPHAAQSPLTRESIELGRRLFYEKRLSGNGKVACASCHIQSLGFADGVALSENGVSGHRQRRHAPALINLAFGEQMFWDGGATNLETQLLGPLTSEDEMAADMRQVVAFLNADPNYRKWFRAAFAVDSVESIHVLWALGQFERVLISFDSKYDRVRAGQTTFTESEAKGHALYQANCASCHSEGLLTDHQHHNNGLDATDRFAFTDPENERWGRYRITLDSADIGRYKTPTLRNVSVTAPYMHDGRFATLDQVLGHYTQGIRSSRTLAPQLRGGLDLSPADQQALIAFLHTLTDTTFLTHPSYANPW